MEIDSFIKQGGRKMILGGGGAPFKLKTPLPILTQPSEITVSGS